MPRMIDLIRKSAVPATLMRSAARGALSLPAPEMIEILVYLANDPVHGQTARLTLAGWDVASLSAIAADSGTPAEVIEYLMNASLQSGAKAEGDALPADSRVAEEDNPDNVLDLDVTNYIREHAEEINAAEALPFQLFGATAQEQPEVEVAVTDRDRPNTGSAVSATAAAAKLERERQNPLQKIAKLRVGERVQLAMKGNKDERFILIRDGARVVCNAVLESPKLTDSEVETFAAMKNVQESVLRGIAAKRKFMKNYSVIRILTSNPRCPIDVSVPLLAHLLTQDLKHLSSNKNVPETVRQIAYKMFRERLTSR